MDKGFALKLHKNREAILQFCQTHADIYLYGTGNVANRFTVYLDEEGIGFKGYVVSHGQKKTDEYMGKPVIDVVEFSNKDSGIILSVAEKYHKEITESLKANGIDCDMDVYYQQIYFGEADNVITEDDAYIGVTNDGVFFGKYRDLDEIGLKTGTDKNSLKHNYLGKYDFFLKNYKDDDITLIELGVFNGESLKMWEKYFPHARIIGVDIDENCRMYESDRASIDIQDLSRIDNLEMIGKKYEPSIIIEDASHMWSHQIKSFVTLFPHLKNGGIYIMEDIGTSFGKYRKSEYSDSNYSGFEFMNALTEMVAGRKIICNRELENVFKVELNDLAAMVDMTAVLYGSIIIIKK